LRGKAYKGPGVLLTISGATTFGAGIRGKAPVQVDELRLLDGPVALTSGCTGACLKTNVQGVVLEQPWTPMRLTLVDLEDTEAIATVVEGAQKYASGRVGFGDLAQWSSRSGYRTPSGRSLTDEWWRNVLANPLNAGLVGYRRK
jgi:hypothetical protein